MTATDGIWLDTHEVARLARLLGETQGVAGFLPELKLEAKSLQSVLSQARLRQRREYWALVRRRDRQAFGGLVLGGLLGFAALAVGLGLWAGPWLVQQIQYLRGCP